MNPERTYRIIERVMRDGVYGRLITVVTTEDGKEVREEEFIPFSESGS